MHRFATKLSALAVLMSSVAAAPAHADALLPGALAVALQRHDAGTFYVNGAVEGYGELKMLVDTGSSYLVINEAILESLMKTGNAQYARELSGSMADGSRRIIPVYRVTRLRLGDSCWVNDVEAAVFPGGTRAILGMNVLARLSPFAFSAQPAELTLNRCQSAADLAAAEAK